MSVRFILQIALGVCLGLWLFRVAPRLPWRLLTVIAVISLATCGLVWLWFIGHTELAFWIGMTLFVIAEVTALPRRAASTTTDTPASDSPSR